MSHTHPPVHRFSFDAPELFLVAESLHFHAFRLSLLVALGKSLLSPGSSDLSDTSLEFWADPFLLADGVRISIRFEDRIQCRLDRMTSNAHITLTPFGHARGFQHLEITVSFPDRLLGLSNLVGRTDPTYRTALWNSTPGELNANLFDIIPVLAKAYARAQLTPVYPCAPRRQGYFRLTT